jgi:hypothetical protein
MWNGKAFKPILDHVDGNNSDNRPHMLRLLCPNCDSQQPTRGGANKGRIVKAEGGFARIVRGRRHFTLIAETGNFVINPGGEVDICDLRFDNNVVVAGGVVVADGVAFKVPDDPRAPASHFVGSEDVSMTLVCHPRES